MNSIWTQFDYCVKRELQVIKFFFWFYFGIKKIYISLLSLGDSILLIFFPIYAFWHIWKVGPETRDPGPIMWVRPGTRDSWPKRWDKRPVTRDRFHRRDPFRWNPRPETRDPYFTGTWNPKPRTLKERPGVHTYDRWDGRPKINISCQTSNARTMI